MSPPGNRIALTPTGVTFALPPTRDMFQTLFTPSKAGPTEHLTIFLISLTLLSLFLPFPPPLYLLTFLFWRVSYNLIIGILLHCQSATQFFTKWISTRSPAAQSLLNHISTAALPDSYSWEKSPHELNAWIVFRALSTLILANDGLSYFAFAVRYNVPFRDSHPLVLAVCMPAGVLLLVLSFWAKARAHDVLGDFAWFWGDFFFTVEGKLVFDGVFRLFPHPMYTVGYAGYYGAALLTRSYTVLLLSLMAHLAQLAFLAMVEEPHIRKIYGGAETDHKQPKPHDEPRQLHQLSPHEQFLSTVPGKPVFAVLGAAMGSLALLCLSGIGSTYLVLFVLLSWRVAHWGGCSALLSRALEGDENLWMRLAERRGMSRTRAFSSWQHVYLVSFLFNHALFIVVSFRMGGSESGSLAKDWALMLGGLSMMAVSWLGIWSAWRELGWFGFYYGDFFVEPENRELVQWGSYRYVSHPDVSLGYLFYFGLAAMRQSWGLFSVAVLCQAMHWLFVTVIEQPNIERKYKPVTEQTALENFVEGLPGVGLIMAYLRKAGLQGSRSMGKACDMHVPNIIKTLSVRKEKMRADISKKGSQIWTDKVVGRAADLKSKAEAKVGVLDCDRAVLLLESKGLRIRRVS